MQRFFFHVRVGADYLPDDEGVELSDGEASLAFALRGARSIICDDVERGRLSIDGAVEVNDASGKRVCTLTFRKAVGWESFGHPPGAARPDGGKGS